MQQVQGSTEPSLEHLLLCGARDSSVTRNGRYRQTMPLGQALEGSLFISTAANGHAATLAGYAETETMAERHCMNSMDNEDLPITSQNVALCFAYFGDYVTSNRFWK